MGAKDTTQSLTLRYILALALIALLATSAFLNMRRVIVDNSQNAAIINLAGRQRMLSQQITMHANKIASGNELAALPEMYDRISQMDEAHQTLAFGGVHPSLKRSHIVRSAAHSIYTEPPYRADELTRQFLATARAFATHLAAGDVELAERSRTTMNALAEGDLLVSLDAAVATYQRISEEAIGEAFAIEKVVWAATLLLLLLEALLIYRPITRRVTREINELDAARQSLAESEERFMLAAQGASVGIWDWIDVASEKEYWSDNFYALLGLRRGDIPASVEGFKSLLHPDDHEKTFAAVESHFTRRTPFLVEYRLRHQDGGYRWFLGAGQAVWDSDGSPRRMIGSIMDIDERKKAETIKNEFIATVSHELRTPMTSIMGAIGLVRSGRVGEINVKTENLLRIAEANGDRLVRLINDILDIERIDSGRLMLKWSDVDIVAIARQAVEQNAAFVDKHHSVLKATLSDAPVFIRGDADRLVQVITNLISNAAKFTGDDGDIHVSLEETSTHVAVIIADNGVGIPADKLEAIFERFVQIDNADNRANQGSGLGLAITKSIVQAHRGDIEIESRVGEGTRFRIEFPRLAAANNVSTAA